MEIAKSEPEAHIARIFAIVGIKHWEDLKMRKFKGRIVLGGDKIKTAVGQWAVFQEIGRVPATMTACRILLVVFSLVRNVRILQSDCVRAYVQAEMTGPTTYIRMPKAWWPKEWAGKFRDPVCRLQRALYGHPNAGDIWGDKLEAELVRLGFASVEGWPSVYVLYPEGELAVAFVVYVDDLLTVGSDYLIQVFEQLKVTINFEEPTQIQKYLGCVHEITRKTVEGEVITEVSFNMIKYFEAALDQYREVAREKITPVASPFAPRLDAKAEDELLAEPGYLAPHAASLIMKLMYGARMAGPHIITIVSKMSSRISRWTRDDDRRLHRVYCYLQGSVNLTLKGSLSTEDEQNFTLVAWPDADFCGDTHSTRSTSGFYLEVQGGGGRCFPVGWGSKKQGATTRHTCESETVSLATCVAMEAIPAQHLLQVILRRPVELHVKEDNSATVVSITKGYSPSLRSLKRHHKISLGFLHETFKNEDLDDDEGRAVLMKARTDEHKGDLFTKEMDVQKFLHALKMLGMDSRDITKKLE